MTIYPEHEKLKALDGANQTVGDFIEWIGEQGWELAYYPERANGERGDTLWPLNKSRDDILAMHFEIDRNKLEDEKRAMLAEIRSEPVT